MPTSAYLQKSMYPDAPAKLFWRQNFSKKYIKKMQCIFCLQHASIHLYIYSFSSDILKVYFKLNITSGAHGYLFTQ